MSLTYSRTANLSQGDGGRYRYRLARIWDQSNARRAVFVMLNPSKADALVDDPTIRKCVGFAKHWNQQADRLEKPFGGIVVVNLFAYRATNPKELLTVDDPIGPENDTYIRKEAWAAANADSIVVCAWGANKAIELMNDPLKFSLPRFAVVTDILQDQAPGRIFRLGTKTKNEDPRHPLYLPYSTPLEPMWPVGSPQNPLRIKGKDCRFILVDNSTGKEVDFKPWTSPEPRESKSS